MLPDAGFRRERDTAPPPGQKTRDDRHRSECDADRRIVDSLHHHHTGFSLAAHRYAALPLSEDTCAIACCPWLRK